MEKILTLSVQALKEKLYIAYMMFVLDALDKFPEIGESFTRFTDNFKAAYNYLNQVYLKYDHKFYAEKLNKANEKRSKAFSKFNNYVRSFTLNTQDAEKTAAAERILQIIAMYGASGIFNQGIREISTQLVNLIEDLEERLPAEIQTIGAVVLLAELRAAQQEFSAIYLERTEYDSEAGRQAMADARKRMTEAYRSLVTIVNENVPFDADGQYQGFVRVLNVEIRTLFSHTGQSGNATAGSGTDTDGSETIPVKTATYNFYNGNVVKLKVEVGAPLENLPNTEGYIWKPEIPEFMPNKNCTFKEVAITSKEAIATFHFFDHREEEIRQIVGTILHGPANTTGFYWQPAVPSTMPAEDTSYYELPLEDNGGNNGGSGSGDNTGSGGGDNTGSGGSGENTGGETSNKFTVTYKYPETGEVITTQEYEVGEKIVPPTPPTGYVWGYYPDNMPDRNVFVDALPDVIDF